MNVGPLSLDTDPSCNCNSTVRSGIGVCGGLLYETWVKDLWYLKQSDYCYLIRQMTLVI